MKAVIIYYSSTDNTRLACQYLVRQLKDVEFELIDITHGSSVDVSFYDVVGFAAPTFHMGVPPLFENFIQQLPTQQNKPAFVFNTYGAMSGRMLKNLAKMVTARGFNVIAGYSLLTPENYPPFILKDWVNKDAPNDGELAKFRQFGTELADKLQKE